MQLFIISAEDVRRQFSSTSEGADEIHPKSLASRAYFGILFKNSLKTGMIPVQWTNRQADNGEFDVVALFSYSFSQKNHGKPRI